MNMGFTDNTVKTRVCARRALLIVVFLFLHSPMFNLQWPIANRLCSIFHNINSLSAQEDPEYRMEGGVGVGMVNYLGDFNSNLGKNYKPLGALLAKYRFNPRMSLAMNIGYGTLAGSSKDTETWYPEDVQTPLTPREESFSHSLIDVGFSYEYNFWAYGTGQEYRGARRVVPFISLGLGATYASAPGGAFTANLPLGLGVKYKIGQRWNLTAQWGMHFTMSDNLDGVKDPYTIVSNGLFKNTDCYSRIQVSVTYDFWAKCKTCNNDRD